MIVPSESTKHDLSSEYNIHPDTITVIHSGIRAPEYSGNIRENVQECVNSPYIFWIGRKELRKNIERIVETFEAVKQEHPDLRLILAGSEGYGYKDISRRIQDSSYREDIIELGRVSESEKAFLYQHAEVFLFPSWYEGFGYPVLEAFAHGVPVIAAEASSLPELVGDAGITLPIEGERCHTLWVRATQNLIQNPSRKAYWRDKGFVRLQDFSFEKAVQKTCRVLGE